MHSTAAELVDSWKVKLAFANALLRDDRPFAIMTYEQYLEGGEEYVQLVLSRLNLTHTSHEGHHAEALPAACPVGAASNLSVHRVHSDAVRDTAVNYNAILRSFGAIGSAAGRAPYMTFPQLLHQHPGLAAHVV